MENLDQFQAVLRHVKAQFVAKDEIVDLLGLGLIARENAFLLGPPGTAKSALVRSLSNCIEESQNFEYLLTRYTEPNEIFGPFDIRRLKEGELKTNTEGMLPEAAMVFLDEIFNANSAILNSLLMALNERIFRRGHETRKIPALMFVGASNQLPEEESLAALLDRFLIRIRCGYVDPMHLESVLNAGRSLETGNSSSDTPKITADQIRDLQNQSKSVNLKPVISDYLNLIHSMRNAGLQISDRRAVKLQNLIAASALISSRQEANVSDLWVLRYIWDREEQIELLSSMLDNFLDQKDLEDAHPLAVRQQPDAEDLLKQVLALKDEWLQKTDDAAAQSKIKDRMRYLQNRCAWIVNDLQRGQLEREVASFWEQN